MALTQNRAQARFACIKQGTIFYDFHLALSSGQTYQGLSELTFQLTEVPENLPLDFSGNEPSVTINNEPTQLNTEQGFILLDVNKLKVGINNVVVRYKNKYHNDGQGLVNFVDVNGKQYIYSQFQAYHANKVFAVFDQPDLKAKMRLNVLHPIELSKILSNQYSISQQKYDEESYLQLCKTTNPAQVKQFLKEKTGNMTIFPQSKLLPTYLFCIVAGDYKEIKLQKQRQYRNIPMSIYSIQSLYKELQKAAPFVFQISIQTMKFYQQFFGYKYPFDKYDQVFVHEFNSLAMQNAAIVTYSDIYLWKEKVSEQKMLDFANTIAHELSHHWFGNLVTMKWWDDLWLNESFAELISFFCLEKIKKSLKTINYESCMLSFLQRKDWGYQEDQRVTTHPIRGQVLNTAVAESIFDGITYAKGAATMKQLLFIMEQQNFSKALSAYFCKYAFSNATLIDFLNQMQKVIKTDAINLEQWRKLWLQKASLNVLDIQWNPEDNSNNATMTVLQTYVTPEHPTLRPHKIKIGLFKEDCTVDVIEAMIPATQKTVITYNGQQKYKAILLNYEDHSFVKINIDNKSMDFFKQNLNKIPQALSRTLIWKSFYEMLKDAKITSKQYLQFFCKNISNQASDSVFEAQFEIAGQAINIYTPIKFRQELNNMLFDLIIQMLQNISEEKQNRIVILKENAICFGKSIQNKKKILQWKNNKFEPMKKHQLNLNQQWQAVVKAFTLHEISAEQKQKIFQQQSKIDSSDTSKRKRATCDALIADKQQFEKIYQSYIDPNNQQSGTIRRASMQGWNNQFHSQWLAAYKSRYFSDIVEASKVLTLDHLKTFVINLKPIDDDLQTTIQEYRKIQLVGDKFAKIQTLIKKTIDDLQRRSAAYKLFLECK